MATSAYKIIFLTGMLGFDTLKVNNEKGDNSQRQESKRKHQNRRQTMTEQREQREEQKKEKDQIKFTVRERYVLEGGTGLRVRDVEIAGTSSEDDMCNTIFDLKRMDTDEHVYPFQLDGFEFMGERTYLCISSYGGWGREQSLEIALKNMLSASGITKAKARKLDVLKGMAVYECVKGTGWVSGMGGACGLMLQPVPSTKWMDALHKVVTPKASKVATPKGYAI